MKTKMLTKIRNLPFHLLKDVRFLGMIAFGVVVLLTSWSAVRIVETNYGLQQDIARLQYENRVGKLENQNLELTNQYYKTDTYLELAARRQYNKGKPGETLILVPKEVALSHASKIHSSPLPKDEASLSETSTVLKNLRGWMDFFFRPDSNS